MKPWRTEYSSIQGIALLVFAIVSLLIFYFGVWSDKPLPDHPVIGGFNDLFLHVAAFCALTLTALILRSKPLKVILWLIAIGAGIELIQSLNPKREASLTDIAANILGIAIGFFVWKLVLFITANRHAE